MSDSEINIVVVLVGTLYSSNLGATARAMSNMGASRFVLVNPKCQIDETAKQSAAGSQHFLERAVVYSDIDEFYANEGSGFRIAFSRRPGKLRHENLYDCNEQEIISGLKKLETKNLYLFFGPEDNGLSAKELEMTHLTCALPTYGPFFSLNLSQAVLLALFITQNKILMSEISSEVGFEEPKNVPISPVNFPEKALKNWLQLLGFNLSAKKQNAYLTLKKILMSNTPTEKELSTLTAVIEQTARKLKP